MYESRSVWCVLHRKRLITVLLILSVFILSSLIAPQARAEQDFCCDRTIIYSPTEMPPEQEWDVNNLLQGLIYEGLNAFDYQDSCVGCPISLGIIDYEGRANLDDFVDDILKATGSEPVFDGATRKGEYFRVADYVFYTTLSLDRIDEIHPGYWEEGYDGNPNYVPGNAFGDYSIDISLVNAHFGELVWGGHTVWNGRAHGQVSWSYEEADNAIIELCATMSPNIVQRIYDYEQIPVTCTIQMEQDEVEAGKEVTISLTDITDYKGRSPKRWQRLVITLEHGEILNATRCGTSKQWALEVGEGDIDLRYMAGQVCHEETETITIYNSCDWGGFNVPLGITSPKKKLADKQFTIIDRLPVKCRIRPQKKKVEAGTVISVEVKEFTDKKGKPVGPHERIMVKARKGKILNGMSKDEYKVFEVGKGAVDITYQAPDDCSLEKDIIYVFSACIKTIEQEDSEENLWDIVPKDQIGSKELEITCEHEWSGTLTIEQASTFHCNIEPTEETGWQEMNENEERIQRASLTLTSDDFDLARIPAAGAFPQMIEASGTITCNIRQDRHIRGEAPSTECVSKGEREWVSPGNWMTDHDTTMGQANKPVKSEQVRILFAKETGADKSQMEDLARQMKEAAGSGNVDRIQELQGQLMGMMQGGDGDSVPLRIRVMVNVPSRDEVLMTSERKVYDVCLDRLTTDDSNSDTKEIQLILPMMVELKGTYTKGKNGDDRVEARMQDTDHKPSGKGLGKQKCPDTEYRVTGELNLNRRRK
jgi:hypothetical protein